MVDSFSHVTKLALILITWAAYGAKFGATMILLHIGPIIFGGTDKIIEYLWKRNLLSNTKSCLR